jgi:hypothetical protein
LGIWRGGEAVLRRGEALEIDRRKRFNNQGSTDFGWLIINKSSGHFPWITVSDVAIDGAIRCGHEFD